MENAIKALYMGAGLIIGVLVLGVMVYMFRNGARLGESYDTRKSVEQVQAFNSRFEVYSQLSEQRNHEIDNYSFVTKGNTASDVISCANLAFDINNKHNYDPQNQVQVMVDIGTEQYYIYPFEVQAKNKFVKDLTFNNVKSLDESRGQIDDSKYYDFYDFLTQYSDVRIVNMPEGNYKVSNELIYKYYFDVGAGDIEYSDVTGKVTSITFHIYETEHYDTDRWKDV